MRDGKLFLVWLAGLSFWAPLACNDELSTETKSVALTFDEQGLADSLVKEGMGRGQAYSLLSDLLEKAPTRLSGSQGYEDAVHWGVATLRQLGFENVRKEAVMVPRWQRGPAERAVWTSGQGNRERLAAAALGGSIGTPANGLIAKVVLVQGMAELAEMEADRIEGKVVFLNQGMDPTLSNTFQAYGRAVGQRSRGAIEASRKGAVAVVIRSMSTAADDEPHTGAMRYAEDVPPIPAFALGIQSADRLEAELRAGVGGTLELFAQCRTLSDIEQWNVVGELPGSEHPDEIVILSGHLDCWDLGHGAHDDAGGCIHALEAARLLKAVGHRPKRTIRVVLYANEENGRRGGDAYAEDHRNVSHHFAFESDSGAFAPRGIALNLNQSSVVALRRFGRPFEAFGAGGVFQGGGGVDIAPLRDQGVPVGSLRVNDARYFDVHHSRNDTIEAVHPRELQLGAVLLAYWCAIVDDLSASRLQPPD
ncbi:MAG: M20/M25/M40 family metallo-hydrolase [Planctomycetota bacterium]|nr:MAG: M20/M25/M40 family metallo-hydrolase [Planctomycetota bacterium]